MENYFYFYDLNEVLIDRYPAKIATLLNTKYNINNFIFIYSEKYNDGEPKNIPNGSKTFYIKDLSKRKLKEIIAQYPPISLITIAQRIPDMWMLNYFNSLGYPTFLVQHGLWSDRLERIPLIPLLFGKFSKFINYLKHVSSICKLNRIPLLYTLFDLYRFLLKENINIPDTKYLHNDLLRANKAFVFDESWNDYYVVKYGYNINNLKYIGNPDFLLLKNKYLNDKEDAVCYLCQSLVEDGRFIFSEYNKFLNILNKVVATNKKLYIKLHPRSRMEFYDIFKYNKNVILTHDLPICKYYIGHYTGLLVTIKQITDDILIWKFPDHHTPEYFLQFGSIITSNPNDLIAFIQDKIEHKNIEPIRKLSKYELETFDPIKIIAENLLKITEKLIK
jgi:hypothetical protein